MAYQAYKDQRADHLQSMNKYLQTIPPDHGMVQQTPYTAVADPNPPYVLNAVAGNNKEVAPLYTNPSAALYAQGSENRVLLGASNAACGGCLNAVQKPDPRLRQVKPLYNPSVFRAAPGQQLPTSYNVVGMY